MPLDFPALDTRTVSTKEGDEKVAVSLPPTQCTELLYQEGLAGALVSLEHPTLVKSFIAPLMLY